MKIEIKIDGNEENISKIKLLAHKLDCENNQRWFEFDMWFMNFTFPIFLFFCTSAFFIMWPLMFLNLNGEMLDLSGDWARLILLVAALIATAFFSGIAFGSRNEHRIRTYMDLVDSLLRVKISEELLPLSGKSIVSDVQKDKSRPLPTDLLLIAYAKNLNKDKL